MIPSNRHWTADPTAQQEVLEAVGRVIARGNFMLGEEVDSFEREFSAISGVEGCGVGSGTDALTIALMAGGIGAGDEVLLPAFAPAGTITGVLASGATPVLIDATQDLGLDLRSAQRAITPHSRGLICVHLFGRMDRMIEISAFSKAFNLWVVEDCAHAHGAMLWDTDAGTWRLAGTIGDAAAFSFYPTKNLGACGDAGYCGTRHAGLLPHLRRLRQYGWTRRDHAETLGRNTRLDEMQACILRVGLRSLLKRNQRRRMIASNYHKMLSPNLPQGSELPAEVDTQRVRVFHQYVMQSPDRDRLLQHLRTNGIGFGVHYPALHQQPAFARFARKMELPVVERLSKRVVSLPIYPELSNPEVETICEILTTFWRMQEEAQFSSVSRFPS
jgi:dTDP-4-amino-4,6-dideoxygalactose transaminase